MPAPDGRGPVDDDEARDEVDDDSPLDHVVAVDGCQLGEEHAGEGNHRLDVAGQANEALLDVVVGQEHVESGDSSRDGAVGGFEEVGRDFGVVKAAEDVRVEIQLGELKVEHGTFAGECAKVFLILLLLPLAIETRAWAKGVGFTWESSAPVAEPLVKLASETLDLRQKDRGYRLVGFRSEKLADVVYDGVEGDLAYKSQVTRCRSLSLDHELPALHCRILSRGTLAAVQGGQMLVADVDEIPYAHKIGGVLIIALDKAAELAGNAKRSGATRSHAGEDPGGIVEPVSGDAQGTEVVAVDAAVEDRGRHETPKFTVADWVDVVAGRIVLGADGEDGGRQDGAGAAEGLER